MEKQHSPLPWKVNADFEDPVCSVCEIVSDVGDGKFDLVCNMSGYDTEIEDASLIVKSVNNHDALTKALKTCVAALYAHPDLSSRAREAIQEAEALLGQLEGKE